MRGFIPMAHPTRIREKLSFVESASLDTLIEAFPQDWQAVGEGLVQATATHKPEAIAAFVQNARAAALPHRQRVEKSRKNPQVLQTALPYLVRSRMAYLAAQRTLQVAAMGSGRTRFKLWSGFLVQALLFSQGLIRKPVSLRAFRWLWPFVTQKCLLMPLVQPKGIYAFYTRELIAELAGKIAGRPALEIAAGDGCLSRFLTEAKALVRPTDDYSWNHAIPYPSTVEKIDAVEALRKYQPTVVLCSFPPPANTFEATVFQTDSVKEYWVITTRHRFAAGNWQAYETQTGFRMQADPALSRLVLPPEIDPLVLQFQRR